MRTPTQFSLRRLLILVGAVALLLSQYPFIEVREVPFQSTQAAGPASWVETPAVEYRLARRPTRGFIAVATIEGLFLLYWLYRWQRFDRDQGVIRTSSPCTDSTEAARRR